MSRFRNSVTRLDLEPCRSNSVWQKGVYGLSHVSGTQVQVKGTPARWRFLLVCLTRPSPKNWAQNYLAHLTGVIEAQNNEHGSRDINSSWLSGTWNSPGAVGVFDNISIVLDCAPWKENISCFEFHRDLMSPSSGEICFLTELSEPSLTELPVVGGKINPFFCRRHFLPLSQFFFFFIHFMILNSNYLFPTETLTFYSDL